MRHIFAVLMLLFVWGPAVLCAAAPEVSVPLVRQAPTVDGVIHDEEWGRAVQLTGLHPYGKGEILDGRQTQVWLTSDGEKIYLAMRSEVPPNGRHLSRAPRATSDRRAVLKDDNIELWLDPSSQRLEGPQRYFQIIANADGALLDMAHDPSNKQQVVDLQWRVEWDFKTSLQDGFWHVEAAIPLAALDATEADLARPWGVRIVRNWMTPRVVAETSPDGGAFAARETMMRVHWLQEGPVARMLRLRPEGGEGVELALELVNPGTAAQEVQVHMEHQIDAKPWNTLNKTYQLAPGQRELVLVRSPLQVMGTARAKILVTRPGVEAPLLRREIEWQIDTPHGLWAGAENGGNDSGAMELAFYPYYHKLKSQLNLEGLSHSNPAQVAGARLTVRPAEGDTVLAEGDFPAFRKARSEIVLDLPELGEGEYVAQIAVLDAQGKTLQTIQRTFTRQVFPWEHNTLGMEKIVFPPFTAVETQGRQVKTVLRTHELGESGLWDQVVSEGHALLAAPMRLKVRVGGEDHEVRVTQPATLRHQEPAQADYEAAWQAGPITGQMSCSMELDGLMMVTMRLRQAGDAAVERLDLEIPLRDDIAPLFHAVTDRAHIHYAGKTPEGEGLVWESRQASRYDLPGTWMPYVWLGNERQGLAWATDSDRDWLSDDERSAMDLRREGGQLILTAHFVTRPAPLGRERAITFAFQATPTKPMPAQPAWRQWNFATRLQDVPQVYTVNILGSGLYWGAGSSFGALYPRGRDFTFFDLMRQARETGKVDEAGLKQWQAGYKAPPEMLERYFLHSEQGLRRMANQADEYVVYTNARGYEPNEEFLTFQDEWLSTAYSSRVWPKQEFRELGANAQRTRSFQDYGLWYFNKMLETGAVDGIYFDLVYPLADFDRIAGNAYLDDQGNLRPGASLFAMREYVRRMATLGYQKRGRWLNVSHMTTTQLALVNTWVAANLDWEFRYGLDDYQDRFGRDFIRTSSIGTQTGCVPLVLEGTRGETTPQRRAFVHRTAVGLALLHEIRIWQLPEVGEKVLRAFYEFGYGQESCRVWRYWDKPEAATVEGLDAETLVLSRGGEAMVLLVGFADQDGQGRLRLDAQALGLRSGGRFVNVETREIFSSTEEGACEFSLPRHDFLLLHYK